MNQISTNNTQETNTLPTSSASGQTNILNHSGLIGIQDTVKVVNDTLKTGTAAYNSHKTWEERQLHTMLDRPSDYFARAANQYEAAADNGSLSNPETAKALIDLGMTQFRVNQEALVSEKNSELQDSKIARNWGLGIVGTLGAIGLTVLGINKLIQDQDDED